MSDRASRALCFGACFGSALIALFISGAVANAQGQPSQGQPSQEQPSQEQPTQERPPQEQPTQEQPQQAPTTVPVLTSPKPAPAIASWQQAVVARLVRFQRYPAQAKGATGVVNLSFSIDRQGHVLNSRVVKSSGSAVLDTEALSLLTRAAPLPPPPSTVPDKDLTFLLPVRFVLK